MTVSANRKQAALFALWTLHGLVALWQFLSLPAEGVSLARALMGALLSAWTLFSAALVAMALRNSQSLARWRNFIAQPRTRDILLSLSLLAVLARIWISLAGGLLEAGNNFDYSAYIQRLDPLLTLIFFISFEIALLILFFSAGEWKIQKDGARAFALRLAISLLVLAFAALLVFFTGWGVIPGYKGDWSRGIPAVALMEWHILLAGVFSVATVVLETRRNFPRLKNLDRWIFLAVWAATATLWLSQPLVPNSSALAPHEPNFEPYPFSDAQVYDQFAQSVLVGNGYGKGEIPQRPLYIVMLVVMRVVAGQDYNDVIFLQTLLFAFFPALLYLFGKEFFGRPLGISLALLAALRDYTSNIAAPFTGNLTYSKLLLAEIPTAMLLILFLWLGIRWIRAGFPLFWGFLLGGVIGVAMLIRTQAAMAFPVLLLFALLIRPRDFSAFWKSAALAAFAVGLVASPWLARNWRITGKPIFDNPASQTANLALRYSRVNGERVDISKQPGESDADYNARMFAIGKEAFLANPYGIGREVLGAFLNHGINNILLFPLRYDLDSPAELWKPTKAFWQQWHGNLNLAQSLLLVFFIFLFGLGVAFAWHKLGWLGLLPLGANLAYNLWTSIALLSGQRFMVVMDWSAYMYYMIGVFALLGALMYALNFSRGTICAWFARDKSDSRGGAASVSWRAYLLAGGLFFMVGASLWAVEALFPQRYLPASRGELAERIVSSPAFHLDEACFKAALAGQNVSLAQGRALYPRYYWAGDGETFTDAAGYKKTDYGRMVFEMAGDMYGRALIPISEQPDFFPHASNVILGTDSTGALFVLVEREGQARFYVSDNWGACRGK